jgi:cell division protein FtsI (penicillin-binding protein 3)/stage V sporulation protein D (sporulation-specific penicillin-binding protein)
MRNFRINFILFFVFCFGLLIIGRLFYLQILKGDLYKAMAQGQQISQGEVSGQRGEIFFSKGEPLAISVNWPFVFADTYKVKDKALTAEKLSSVLGLEKEYLLGLLKESSSFKVLKKKLSNEEIEQLEKLRLAGIEIKKDAGRYYPQENLAAQVVGFLDADKKGQYGLENYYNDVLKPKKGQSGSNLYLTLDYSIQFMAEKLLSEAKENLEIEGGEIVVMEPKTGKILALANNPSFDPNQYSKVKDISIFQNSVTQKIFEPGSIFKPITMVSALEEEKVTPETTYIDKGILKIGGYTIYNYGQRTWGEMSMTSVLEKSINTGAVFAEQKLGNTLFMDYLERFGFFRRTGIDLQEIYSENKELKKGYEINFATASFGQGIEITPIQLLKAYSGILNNGRMVKPYIVEKTEKDGKVKETKTVAEEDTIVSPKAISQLTGMLINVVTNGYAKSAQIPGYYVAGKTGTAQIAWSALNISQKGYSDKTWQSFMGFAPALNPQFLILVKLNNPKTNTAEYSAVPIFHELAKYIIDYYQIPPDHTEESI